MPGRIFIDEPEASYIQRLASQIEFMVSQGMTRKNAELWAPTTLEAADSVDADIMRDLEAIQKAT